jgi:hypothetical protein
MHGLSVLIYTQMHVFSTAPALLQGEILRIGPRLALSPWLPSSRNLVKAATEQGSSSKSYTWPLR